MHVKKTLHLCVCVTSMNTYDSCWAALIRFGPALPPAAAAPCWASFLPAVGRLQASKERKKRGSGISWTQAGIIERVVLYNVIPCVRAYVRV